MSTRAQRKQRAQGRRTADPVADRLAARDAIAAEYDVASTAAFEEASRISREAYAECGRKVDAAWSERCRKMSELEARGIPAAEAALEAAEESVDATERLVADLRGQAAELEEDR